MSTTQIHPTAVIDPRAELGEGVEVGPHAIIEAGVRLGDRCKVGPLVHIQGQTEIGPDNQFFTASTIGFPPQVVGFGLGATRTVIGARNTFREYVTVHASMKEDGVTRVGDDGYFMVNSHIAHDCHVGDRVIMANGALLGGHVSVGDRAFVSGNAVVHQFCRIGRLTMVGGLARVTDDCPPFTIIEGIPARIRGLNVVGLRRAGLTGPERMELKRVLRDLYRPGLTLLEALAAVSTEGLGAAALELLDFYRQRGKRGITPFSLAHRAGHSEDEA